MLKEKETSSKAGKITSVSRQRLELRRRGDSLENEFWNRRDFDNVAKPKRLVSDELDADPRDAARLSRSRQQVQEGEIYWGIEDDEDPNKSDAGA